MFYILILHGSNTLASRTATKSVDITFSTKLSVPTLKPYNIHVSQMKPGNYLLNWNFSKNTFESVIFMYHVETSATIKVNYLISVSQISLLCVRGGAIYTYNGLKNSTNAGQSFPNINVKSTSNSVGYIELDRLLTPVAVPLTYQSWSPYFGDDSFMDDGQLIFNFPDLKKIQDDGGAICTGSATVLFQPEI
ncbi:hypothetical protein CWG93_18925 [Salmonella enterica subsp. enterica serovar Sandiego]|nr:hypothetical protein [Salmonella enterica subsp. enterica serovar Sandiego]